MMSFNFSLAVAHMSVFVRVPMLMGKLTNLKKINIQFKYWTKSQHFRILKIISECIWEIMFYSHSFICYIFHVLLINMRNHYQIIIPANNYIHK